jgi:phosphopantetheinyl transferase
MARDKKLKLFYSYWTSKEAYLKLKGLGLPELG